MLMCRQLFEYINYSYYTKFQSLKLGLIYYFGTQQFSILENVT